MTSSLQPNPVSAYDLGLSNFDLSELVGFPIKVFSDQFPGKVLTTRIVAVLNQRLVAESSRRHESIDNLVNRQIVVIQFPYRGQLVSVKAQLNKSNGGRCCFELDNHATPLSQRRYHRVPMNTVVNLAPFPATGILSRKISKLRWMETSASNFSAGGTMVTVPTVLHTSVKLLVNIRQDQFKFPDLVMAKVCHSYQYDDISCRAGIEFITRELASRLFSPSTMDNLQAGLFTYTNVRREKLNRAIVQWDRTNNRMRHIGAHNESS